MLYEVQNRKVFSLRLKVCVLLVWRTLCGRVFQTLRATILKARSPLGYDAAMHKLITRTGFLVYEASIGFQLGSLTNDPAC